MNRPEPFAAAAALFDFVVHDVPAFKPYTTPSGTLLWLSSIRKLNEGLAKELTLNELVMLRLFLRAFLDGLTGDRDAAVAQVCLDRLPLYSPDAICEALERSLTSFARLFEERAAEAAIAQATSLQN